MTFHKFVYFHCIYTLSYFAPFLYVSVCRNFLFVIFETQIIFINFFYTRHTSDKRRREKSNHIDSKISTIFFLLSHQFCRFCCVFRKHSFFIQLFIHTLTFLIFLLKTFLTYIRDYIFILYFGVSDVEEE